MHLINVVLLAIALSGGLVSLAAGQTRRIALASHAGRNAAEASDNFGWPAGKGEFVVDSLVRVSNRWAKSYNRSRGVPYSASEEELKKAPWQSWEEKVQYRYPWQATEEEAIRELQQRYPAAKLVGFDKLTKPVKRKKTSSRIQVFPKRPFQYSYWRGLATVAALGAVGWLLGRKSNNV